MLEDLDWKFPPDVLLRQDDLLMRDLQTISWRRKMIKEMMKGPAFSIPKRKRPPKVPPEEEALAPIGSNDEH